MAEIRGRRMTASSSFDTQSSELKSGAVTVVVAASQAALRRGVATSLGFGFAVVAEAASVVGLADVLATMTPDLLLVDAALPGSLEAALALTEPPTRAVVLADVPRRQEIVHALRHGAQGFLPWDIEAAQLRTGLQDVLDGQPALSRAGVFAIVEELVRSSGTDQTWLRNGARVHLTHREQEVAGLLSERYSTKAIAAALGVSTVTVRRHVSDLMHKLGAATRADAIELLRAPGDGHAAAAAWSRRETLSILSRHGRIGE